MLKNKNKVGVFRRQFARASTKYRSKRNRVILRNEVAAIPLRLSIRRIMGLTIFIGICVGAVRSYEYFTTSPKFNINNVVVTGVRDISKDEILKWAQINIGENIFLAKLSSAAKRVLINNSVSKTEIKRKLPNTVVINILEMIPVALIGSAYQLNNDGIITPTTINRQRGHLPVLKGITVDEKNIGKRTDDTRIKLSLIMIKALDSFRESFSLYDVTTVNIESLHDVKLVLSNGTVVRLGTTQFNEKLLKLKTVLLHLANNNKKAACIDLRFHDEAAVMSTTSQ